MGKRHSKRIPVRLNAEIVPAGKNPAGFIDKLSGHGIAWYKYTGVIENLSGNGICIRVASSENGMDYTPGSRHKIKFQLLTKETLELHCEVVWSNKILLRDFGSRKGIDPLTEYTAIGMKITIPTDEYKKLFKTRLKQHH